MLVVLAVVGGAYLAFADDEPVKISNAEELEQIRDDLDGHYVLVDDIDLSHVDNFEPIGGFTGTFDGNGHTISGLTIDRPEIDSVGMFGTVNKDTRLLGLVDKEGTIKKVSLQGVNVTGGDNVGSLVGTNRGTVTESSTEGNVSGSRRVGGLVGWNGDTIMKSHAEVEVTGDEWVGGLVGSNPTKDSVVAKSSATGDVSGGEWNGGLVAVNGGEVRASYATGDVEGGGGLVGNNVLTSTIRKSYATGNVTARGGGLVAGNDGEIEESYATGRVTNEDAGGLTKRSENFDGDVANSYWYVNSTGQETSAGGTPLTTEEMTGSAARENMDGFDFGETWRTTDENHPRLYWEVDER